MIVNQFKQHRSVIIIYFYVFHTKISLSRENHGAGISCWGSSIKDVLAKSDFLDTLPSVHGRPDCIARNRNIFTPKRNIFCDPDRRGREGLRSAKRKLFAQNRQRWTSYLGASPCPWSSTFGWPPPHWTGRLW